MRPGILDKWKKERPGREDWRMEAFASDVGDSDSSSDRPAWSHAGEMMGFGGSALASCSLREIAECIRDMHAGGDGWPCDDACVG